MNGKWTTRPIVGAMGDVGPRRLWMSEVRDLVDGVSLTPDTAGGTAAWDAFVRAGRRLERRFRPGVSGVRFLSSTRR